MNRLWVGILAVSLALTFGLWGCGGSEPPPPEDEDILEESPAEVETPEAPPPEVKEEPAEEVPAPPDEDPPAPVGDSAGCDALYLEAEGLYRQANVAFKAFRADETRDNWDKAKGLVGQAQELCDKISVKDPEYERVHELALNCNNLRRTILEMEPSE